MMSFMILVNVILIGMKVSSGAARSRQALSEKFAEEVAEDFGFYAFFQSLDRILRSEKF